MKIAFIGCGNMATFMIRGIVNNSEISAKDILATDPNNDSLLALKEELGISTSPSNLDAVDFADYIFVCVEPKHSEQVAKQISSHLNENKVIISIAAGVSVETLNKYYEQKANIIRVMPNIAISVGEGMCMLCKNDKIEESVFNDIKEIFSNFGEVEIMDEKYINAFIAVASSSPAMIFVMIEAMADAAVSMGIPREMSNKLASQAVFGSSAMVKRTKTAPSILKDKVCSPAGTTIDMIHSLEKDGFRSAIIEALKVCNEKGIAMSSKNMGK